MRYIDPTNIPIGDAEYEDYCDKQQDEAWLDDPTNVPPKETMYKTAFSPMYETYVGITHAYTDVDGEWIFRAYLAGTNPEDYILFRKSELENFVL